MRKQTADDHYSCFGRTPTVEQINADDIERRKYQLHLRGCAPRLGSAIRLDRGDPVVGAASVHGTCARRNSAAAAVGPRLGRRKFHTRRKSLQKLFDSATEQIFAAPQQTQPSSFAFNMGQRRSWQI